VDDPGQFPSFFQAEYDGFVRDDPTISLVADNRLDTADKSGTGMIWLMSKNAQTVAVSTENGAAAGIVKVRSRGRNSTEEIAAADGEEWIMEEDPCDTPFLGRGAIQGALDVDTIVMSRPGCELTAFVTARSLANRPWETPDLKLQYLDSNGTLIGENAGPLGGDPVISIDPALIGTDGDISVTVSAELGTAGVYLVQIRRPFVVREFSISEDAPFIEIGLPVDADLEACELVLVDSETDVVLESFVLPATLTNDGIVVVAGLPMPEADAVNGVAMLPADGSFAVWLLYEGVLVDAVQLGEGSVNRGEGQPYIASDARTNFFRVADIDTNDNASDFAATYMPTPGS
jgi:hypothetical protein